MSAQPIAYFSRRYRLSASHRLHVAAFTDEQNRATYGKCNNPYGHGHNYHVEVTVRGPVNAVTGMVVDLVELDTLAKRELLDRFDVANLNLDAAFRETVPSTENFVIEVERIFREGVPLLGSGGARLHTVRIEETSNNSFEYPVRRVASGAKALS